MGEEIPVFDEWGVEVGKFIPTGSGCLDSIFLFIALVIAWTIGFLIYLFIKLIVKGFRAAKEGDWEGAIGYWLVPGLLTFFLLASLISGAVNVAAEQHQRQKEGIEVPKSLITFVRVGKGKDITSVVDTGYYVVTNNSTHLRLTLFSPDCGGKGGEWDEEEQMVLLGEIKPGESKELKCDEFIYESGTWQRVIPCIVVSVKGYQKTTFCTDSSEVPLERGGD